LVTGIIKRFSEEYPKNPVSICSNDFFLIELRSEFKNKLSSELK